MAAVTICSDFGAPQNKVWHCVHRFISFYKCCLLFSVKTRSHCSTYFRTCFVLFSLTSVFQHFFMKWHVALTPTLPMEHYLIVVRQCKWWLRILTVVPSSVQALSFSRFRLFVTPWTAACQTSLSITNSQRLLKFMSISQWCHPTISSSVSLLLLPSIFPSIRVFSKESVLQIRWPKYWSFSFNISPSNEYSGLISFIMDWLDPLAV